MARLSVAPHLTLGQLEHRYRQARDPVARSQWQIVWLVAQGKSGREAAEVTGYSAKWVGAVVRRYNAEGPDGIGDRRRVNPGRAPILSAELRAALRARLAEPLPDGGLWSGPKVADWIAEQTGQPVGPQCGWSYLVRFGPTPRRARRRQVEAATATQGGSNKGGSPTRSGRSKGSPMPA
jgi:transposase